MAEDIVFEIDRKRLYKYLRMFVFLIPKFRTWWPRKYVDILEYKISDGTLFVKQGVFFKNHKAIPLSKITDVALRQNPITSLFKIWMLQIQTAGSYMPEAWLLSLENPENVRDTILAKCKETREG